MNVRTGDTVDEEVLAFESPAVLEWVMNSSLAATHPVHLEVVDGKGWNVRLRDGQPDPEAWQFLLDLGGPYDLRFADGSVLEVDVTGPADGPWHTVTRWQDATP
ncbi:hypothetical protein GA0074695_2784 [Micromonospora viridifaciens]|uniref:Uncharacterized protein n=1 Tax=Micromonospora viridifaciens TaxID=1881 RepID=A0A1C4WVC7_MICVI|nr:hypothetical protein [Micromonospora viridifaciens]SCF00113.1 hypothetical protein GA0074695_2784 [Micromonospora viridifaciens]